MKYSNLGVPYAGSTTKRWSWSKPLGWKDKGKVYDFLVLVGEKDYRFVDQCQLRWRTASGAAGARTVALKLYETTGGMFDAPTVPLPTSVQVGTATLAFQSCSNATFSYTFAGGSSSGASSLIPLTRVGPVPPGCAP